LRRLTRRVRPAAPGRSRGTVSCAASPDWHSPQALITTLARACYAKVQASTPIRCWKREFGISPNGTTLGWTTYPHCGRTLPCGPFTDRTRGAVDSRNRASPDARRRASSGIASSGRGCILVMRPNCYRCLPCVPSRSLTYGLMHTRGYAASETRASLSCKVVMGHPHPLFYTCVILNL